jgi:hypothetical protein
MLQHLMLLKALQVLTKFLSHFAFESLHLQNFLLLMLLKGYTYKISDHECFKC